MEDKVLHLHHLVGSYRLVGDYAAPCVAGEPKAINPGSGRIEKFGNQALGMEL
jgi:hypothetical protein